MVRGIPISRMITARKKAKSLDRVNPTIWLDRIPEDIEKEVAKGRIVVCNSYKEMADVIGCDEKIIEKTITDYNRYCNQGYDEEFLKDREFMMPLTTFPFYVLKAYQGIDTCIGGVRVNHLSAGYGQGSASDSEFVRGRHHGRRLAGT